MPRQAPCPVHARTEAPDPRYPVDVGHNAAAESVPDCTASQRTGEEASDGRQAGAPPPPPVQEVSPLILIGRLICQACARAGCRTNPLTLPAPAASDQEEPRRKWLLRSVPSRMTSPLRFPQGKSSRLASARPSLALLLFLESDA
ncbi:hypothetical protein PVAP13_6NG352200 [Panicum virgatum]|uniref:Uncharacterized protein n=1 Tax=Panicum virgatum TaxID=38727 RepID=A0A8T0R5W9_PANVG|nr:hypothetical protein PVAP13_6NG352200 [Panicum virgatum]